MLREPIVSRVRAILLSHPHAKFYNEHIDSWIRAVMEIEPDRAEWHAVREKKARAMLAERFPSGSAKDEIERRKFALGKGEGVDVIARLAGELIAADAKQAA